MITIDEPNIYLMWEGQLVQVVGIADGKVIHMQGQKKCEHCGTSYQYEYSFLEDSPYFQSAAKPVPTISTEVSTL